MVAGQSNAPKLKLANSLVEQFKTALRKGEYNAIGYDPQERCHIDLKPKGQSGKPKGRPKGRPNFATALRLALDETVTVSERGKTTRIKKLDCALRQQANKAAAGDVKALTLIAQLMREWLGEEPDQNSFTIVISEDDSKL